jgi:hypothetical protein
MFLIGLGALLVLGGVLYTVRAVIWRGSLSGELAGHSPYGNRCSSVDVAGQFLTSVTPGLPL